MRATARLADVSFNTVAKLLTDAGKVYADLHDELVQGVTVSRIHKSLRVTPAVAAGLSETVWDMADLVRIMDERGPKPGPRAPYKKRISN